MSTDIEFDKLNAYVDGALDDAEVARVSRYLAKHPDARAYVERLRNLNVSLTTAYAGPLDQPVPAAIRATILARAGDPAALRQPGVVERLMRWLP